MSRGKEDLPLLIVNFMGQIVRISTTQNITSAIITNDGPIAESYPLTYEGILIDEDETKYYLGDKINQITKCIEKSKFVGMEIVEEEDELDNILKEMPNPTNNNEVN